MQVLEHGNQAPIITCSCGCKFMYENSDIVTTKDVETETKTVTCPECGEKNTIIVEGDFWVVKYQPA